MSEDIKLIKKQLHKIYKGGHPDYIDETFDELELYSKKNADYAKGGDPFGNFKRVGAILSLYPNLKPSNPVVVCIIYLLKQLDCILWMLSMEYDGNVEGKQERFTDIYIYAKIGKLLDNLASQEKKEKE